MLHEVIEHPGNLFYHSCSSSESEEEPANSSSVASSRLNRTNQKHVHYVYYPSVGLDDSSSNSESISNATLTDSEVALARDATLLAHKKSSSRVTNTNVSHRSAAMSRRNGRLGAPSSHNCPNEIETDFEPTCLVRTPSGSVYIPPGMNKSLEYNTNSSSCDNTQKTDLQKTIQRCAINYSSPVPVLPIRNNLHRPSSTHHFPSQKFHFRKDVTSKCTWKCVAILFILLSILMGASLVYLIISNLFHWSNQNSNSCAVLVNEENSEALAKTDQHILKNSNYSNKSKILSSIGGKMISSSFIPNISASEHDIALDSVDLNLHDAVRYKYGNVSVLREVTNFTSRALLVNSKLCDNLTLISIAKLGINKRNVRSLLQVSDYDDDTDSLEDSNEENKIEPEDYITDNSNIFDTSLVKNENISTVSKSEFSGQSKYQYNGSNESSNDNVLIVPLHNNTIKWKYTTRIRNQSLPIDEKSFNSRTELGNFKNDSNPNTWSVPKLELTNTGQNFTPVKLYKPELMLFNFSIVSSEIKNHLEKQFYSVSLELPINQGLSEVNLKPAKIMNQSNEFTTSKGDDTAIVNKSVTPEIVNSQIIGGECQCSCPCLDQSDDDYENLSSTLSTYTSLNDTNVENIFFNDNVYQSSEKITTEFSLIDEENTVSKVDITDSTLKNDNTENVSEMSEELSTYFSRRTKTSPIRTIPPDGTTFSEIKFGQKLTNEVPAYSYWNMQFYQSEPSYVKFDYSFPRGASVAVYGRKNALPTHTQYHIVELLNGFINRATRTSHQINIEKEVVHFLEAGQWFLSLYNDNGDPVTVSVIAVISEDMTQSCPNGCSSKGHCISGKCKCNTGFGGDDCSQTVCPILCNQHGDYINGECQCNPGWKGKDCGLRYDECEVPDCNGHGQCLNGQCSCIRGFKGKFCDQVDCPHSTCSGHGFCLEGTCICKKGWKGADCSQADKDALQCLPACSGHGKFDIETQTCTCNSLWSGEDCSKELCDLDCGPRGHCVGDSCICVPDWTGEYCNVKLCDARCNEHGQCKNGTCLCVTGWNGKHCTLEGCSNSCSGHGQCRVNIDNAWECQCSEGWFGKDCSVQLELNCNDGKDNDKDNLIDCEDPECCKNDVCKSSQLCVSAPLPKNILNKKQPPIITASFFDRSKFLIEEGSLQNYAKQDNFNESRSAVVRGRVTTDIGIGLVGVRVSTNSPLEGFTLTREDGEFDLLVNGGGAIVLQFGRSPFKPQNYVVYVPWNEIVIIETVIMSLNDEDPTKKLFYTCKSHNYDTMKPIVLATWKHSFQGGCPERSAILAESQVVQESVQIPGTGLNLIYHSSKSPGYLSTIQLQLTPDVISINLKLIHLSIAIEGILFEKKFEADPNIRYTYAWNRLNVYKQRVYGVTTALVKVGYEYTDCKNIIWDTQTTKLSGNDMSISDVGGWNLDIHHRYNFHEGILQKGDGSNIYLKHKPRIIRSCLGDGHQRTLDCTDCHEISRDKTRLLAPVALTAAADGSLFIGDFNLIRRMFPDGVVKTVVRLNVTKVAYRYHLASSPLDDTLYISDPESHLILKVRNIDDFTNTDLNWEPFIGSGERCFPGDEAHCGDGGLARDAKLAYPKGIAVSADNVIYFADGTNIRMVDKEGIISTIIGNHMHKSHWTPMPCEGTLNLEEVHLRWPTDLSISPLDNSLHIVDDHMILRLTNDGRIKIVAGRPLHCHPTVPLANDLEFATQATLVMPQSITFASNGDLYIAESDSQRINRVRVIGTDGRISHYAGSDSKCNCLDRKCDCFEETHLLAVNAKFNTISAIAVSPDGILYIADQANYRIRSVTASIPSESEDSREYEVYSPETQELYIFNRFGQHVATKNILTGEISYSFTYSVNTSSGKLSTITDTAGNKVFLLRDHSGQVTSIENTKGQKCRLKMTRMRMLSEITTPDNYNITFDYHGDSGLLKSKLDSAGRSYVYHYDDFGRLTGAVTPTGKAINLGFDLSIRGATVKATYEDKQSISMTVRGSTVITKTGESEKRVSVSNDGTLVTVLPWGSIVITEMIPYSILADVNSILAESYPVPAKQKVEIDSEVANKFEWKYFLRKISLGPKQKANIAEKSIQVGRKLRVNGQNLLTLEYDRDSKTLAIFLDDRVELLNITYDRTARPVKWIPKNSAFAGVQLEYDRFSRLSVWRWGALTEKYGYDRAGRLSEIRYADDTSTIYAFKDMSSSLPLKVTTPRGSDYLLEYDEAGALKSLTTPRGHIHTFSLQTSLGFYKYQYYSPISRHPFELHYNEEGKIIAKLYPHHSGKISYVYDQSGRIDTILTGLSSVHYTYQGNTNLMKNVDIVEPAFELKNEFSYVFGLLKDEKLKFGAKTNLHNIEIKYQYDGNARISRVNVIANNKNLPVIRFKYNVNLGNLENINELRFYRNAFNRSVIQDNSKQYFMVTEYDSHGRIKSFVVNIKSVDLFKMELEYDSRSRISSQKLIYNRKTYVDRMAYSADGHLVEVNGKNNWKYVYDENGNSVGIIDQGQKLSLSYDSGDRIVQVGDIEVKEYDVRGFVVKNGRTKLIYDDSGHLFYATDGETFNTFYRYDHRGRLISISDNYGNTTQMLYTNPHKPELITILYNLKNSDSYVYIYDDNDVLVAIESSEQKYYIASDHNGSPLIVFDSAGNIVKEIRRSPFGKIIVDSNISFYIAVGFQKGIPDPRTGLVYLNKRWYDPTVGQWMTSNWEKLVNEMTTPTDIFVYRFHNNDPINSLESQQVNYMTDLNNWMLLYGYNIKRMLGSTYIHDVTFQPSARIKSPQLASDYGLISGLQCIVGKIANQFEDFGFVPQPLLKMESRTRNLLPRVAYRKSVFDEGLLISRTDNSRALISTVEGVNTVVQDVITSVFNNSHFLDLHFTHHDQDLFYFVKDNPLKIKDDMEELRRLGSMFNVSTHDTADGKELRLHNSGTLISIRYGTEPQQERHRLLKHAHKRAVDRAWELEKTLVIAGLSGAKGDWTNEEKDELILRGRIDGYDGIDIHSVQRYPELADDPGNISFKKDSTKRKRKRRNHKT